MDKHWKRLVMAPLAAFIFTTSVVGTANAGIITQFHNDLAGFNTAVGGLAVTVEDFTDSTHFPISTGVLNSTTNLPGIGIVPGTIQPGVTYSTAIGSGNFFNIDGGGGFSSSFLDTVTGVGPLTIAFDANTLGFGFLSGPIINGLSVTINFDSAPQQVFNPFINNSINFYGFVSSVADIQSVQIGGSTNPLTFAIDDFRFTTGSAPIVPTVPAPATLALFGLGLAGLGWSRRKKA